VAASGTEAQAREVVAVRAPEGREEASQGRRAPAAQAEASQGRQAPAARGEASQGRGAPEAPGAAWQLGQAAPAAVLRPDRVGQGAPGLPRGAHVRGKQRPPQAAL
jgi:hypothetical protein